MLVKNIKKLNNILFKDVKNLELDSTVFSIVELSNKESDKKRSYLQFLSQKKKISKNKYLFLEIFSFIGLPVLILIIIINKIFFINNNHKINNIIICPLNYNFIPKIFYKDKTFHDSFFKLHIDLKILYQILLSFKYYPSFYFLIKILYKIALYSYLVNKFHPKRIITSLEFSFTSSWLTSFCREKKIIHANYMHGEKILNYRDVYFTFDEMYVWDKNYINIFKSLGTSINKYIIYNIPVIKKIKFNKKYYITYYLTNDLSKIDVLINYFNKLNINKKLICFRINPKTKNKNYIYSRLKDFSIEDPVVTNVELSVNSTNYVVSIYSTILFHVSISGFIPVIDDISYSNTLSILKIRQYNLLNKKHELLSNLILKN